MSEFSQLDGTDPVDSDPAGTVAYDGVESTIQSKQNIRYAYAIGQVQPRFSSLGVEKEFAQLASRYGDTAGFTDRQTFQATLSDPSNRHLARHMCWVFMISGLETYLLAPRDRGDVDLLIQSVRPAPRPTDLDVALGLLGPLSQPEDCGLVVPILAFDQLYSFDRDSLLEAIPSDEGMTDEEHEAFLLHAGELLDRILQLTDNAGAADEHRALNYLACRYPNIYTQTAIAHQENASLVAVDVRNSRLTGLRKVLDVIFSYNDRRTDVTSKYFVRVDVTEEFPFVVTKLSPYYDR